MEAHGQDGGGLQVEDIVTDVPHFDLREGLRSVVGLQTLVVTGSRLWNGKMSIDGGTCTQQSWT